MTGFCFKTLSIYLYPQVNNTTVHIQGYKDDLPSKSYIKLHFHSFICAVFLKHILRVRNVPKDEQ